MGKLSRRVHAYTPTGNPCDMCLYEYRITPGAVLITAAIPPKPFTRNQNWPGPIDTKTVVLAVVARIPHLSTHRHTVTPPTRVRADWCVHVNPRPLIVGGR
eukprot:GHVU01138996.1.p2 GENE.GHVU01138996.1~~GHVU01138996.1.p2  ORF type:complete len:101 (+),score=2.88 GHVU01138996.1:1067-1369(+)